MTQVSLGEAGLEVEPPGKVCKSKANKVIKRPWPKELPARVVAVRDLLAELGEATAEEAALRFRGSRAEQAEKLLESPAAVGVAIEAAVGGTRRWSLVR